MKENKQTGHKAGSLVVKIKNHIDRILIYRDWIKASMPLLQEKELKGTHQLSMKHSDQLNFYVGNGSS